MSKYNAIANDPPVKLQGKESELQTAQQIDIPALQRRVRTLKGQNTVLTYANRVLTAENQQLHLAKQSLTNDLSRITSTHAVISTIMPNGESSSGQASASSSPSGSNTDPLLVPLVRQLGE